MPSKQGHEPADKEKRSRSGSGEDLNVDRFDRTISYLRLSLTNRCNLRCIYCSPGSQGNEDAGELSYDEMHRVVTVAVSMGIRKLRLTGGEPLVRKGITGFIRRLTAIDKLDDIRITTNGVCLHRYAEELHEAGIRKINISLDSLRPARFREITGSDSFAQVWKGIEKVRDLGFAIKINMVVLRGINDDEVIDFARLSLTEPVQVRFIEYMPFGARKTDSCYVSGDEIAGRLGALGELLPVKAQSVEGPARVFRFHGAAGTVGFISPVSHKFCSACNRLRLTSDGKLRSCLLLDEEADLKSLLRGGCTNQDIESLLMDVIRSKPMGHGLDENDRFNCHGQMSRIGG